MSDPQLSTPYQARQQRLAIAIQAAGLDAVALNPGPSLVYLTGLHFHLSERPVVVFFIPGSAPVIVLPELEAAKVRSLDFAVTPLLYGEDPSTWGASFHQAAAAARLERASPRGCRAARFAVFGAALAGKCLSGRCLYLCRPLHCTSAYAKRCL